MLPHSSVISRWHSNLILTQDLYHMYVALPCSSKRHSYCRSQHTSHPERTHLGTLYTPQAGGDFEVLHGQNHQMTLDSYMYQRSIQMRLEIYHMNPQSTVERLTFRRYQSLMFVSKCHCGRQQTHQCQSQC